MSRTENKTTATAVVTMTVSVELSQPRGGECTLDEIQKQAREDATEKLAALGREFAARGVRIGEVRSVRIVLNEART